jgi:hypothetical protein
MFEISDDEFETLKSLHLLKESLMNNSVRLDKIEELKTVLMNPK